MAWMQRIMFMARKWLMAAGILVVMPAIVPSSAHAAGTASGTLVSNSVLLQCSLCGAGGITSAAPQFVVDNKVNVSVTDGDGAATSVVAGQASAVSAFTISNLGNTVQDYSLTAANIASGVALFGGTDNFDAACMVRVESGAIPGYDAADTAAFIDELVPDASRTVYVVCDIAASQAGGDLAIVSLAAATLQGGTPGMQGGATAATVGVDTPATVDIVFADSVGSDDAGRDGRHSARGAYLLGTPVTLSKTIANIQDPSGCSAASGCKVVRGSVLTYRIELVVPGAANVSGLVLTDPIPADMTYVPDSIVVNGAATTDAADGDQADFGITSANTVTVSPGSVSAPLTIWFTFRTTIN
jgi:uncharacterized repeat protein (TIGR01451 family)